jgi:hypothetical protein
MGRPEGAGDSPPRDRVPDRRSSSDNLTGPIQVRSERDVLRETFDTFAEGLCVVGLGGVLEVANANGGRLWATALRPELVAAARQTIEGGAATDRNLTLDGRAYAVRAYPFS